jgi:hypothetical protein
MDPDVERVAREWVGRHGPAAVRQLLDRAECAEAIGDTLSADAWREIAEAAGRIGGSR